jgi:hypothetical protein
MAFRSITRAKNEKPGATKVAHSLSTSASAKYVLEDCYAGPLKATLESWQPTRGKWQKRMLRKVNSQMISALEYLLPLLQQGLPATVDFDWTKEAVAKVQDALAEAERD